MRILLLLLSLLLTSCASKKLNTDLSFKIVKRGQYSAEMPRQERLIRNQEALTEVNNDLFKNQSPTPDVPSIDFAQHDLIFLHFGTFNHGGNKFELTDITLKDKELHIGIYSQPLDPNAPVTMAISHPYMLIQIDKLKKDPERIIIVKE